jgi:hypothetical protein
MSTIVTRAGKGSALTHNEVDANFTNLNTDKIQSGNTVAALTITSATIAGGTINGTTVGATTPSTGAFTTLTTSSTVTHNGGTANGVAFLNASKVLTSGSALTFDGTNLAVGSATAVGGGRIGAIDNLNTANGLVLRDSATTYGNNNNYVLLQNSTGVTAGALTHPAINSLGVWSTDDIRFLLTGAASEQMRLTSTGLGIGTSSPLAPLHVYRASASSVRIDTDASASNTQLNFAIAGVNKWSLYRPGSSADLRIFDNATAADVMTWQVGGNVGIGTSSPTEKLTLGAAGKIRVLRSDNARGGEFFADNTGTHLTALASGNDPLFLEAIGTGSVRVTTNATERMRIDSSGNVGIGTSSPGVKLDVVGVARASTRVVSPSFYGSGTGITEYMDSLGTTGMYVTGAGASPSNSIRFFSAGTTTATLDSSGNLGLGGAANRATTAGTKILNIFNGTAPVGTLANGVSFYSASGEANVMDAAGNATLLSPHDTATNEWIFRSKHTPTGKVLKIDVERLLKFVNDHFGLDAVHEFTEE